MTLVDAGGVRLRVEDEGRGGTPVVLLHGFTGSADDWAPMLPAFRERGRVIRVDLLGHGKSDAPPDVIPYTMGACVPQLLRVLDHLGVWQADWVGYSMGGRVALHVAARSPARVRRLVLESASPGLADPVERVARAERDGALADRIERDGVEAFVDEWMKHPLFASQAKLGDARLRELRDARLVHTPQGLAGSLRGLGVGVQPPLHHRLAHLGAPTLLVSGDLDPKFTGILDAMAERMPDARRARVPDAGHNVHVEQPDAYLGAVIPFLTTPDLTDQPLQGGT